MFKYVEFLKRKKANVDAKLPSRVTHNAVFHAGVETHVAHQHAASVDATPEKTPLQQGQFYTMLINFGM